VEFFLIDIGVTCAFLLGYVALVVLKRRGVLAVKREERAPQPDKLRAQARRLIQMR
jgi:hypothetical protein